MALKELSYRTYDELLDAVRTDFQSFNQAGDIDSGDYIKIAQRINYELGLKIYSQKETVIEIEHGRAKLPADFHQLTLALLCYNYRYLFYPTGPGANGCTQLYEEIIPAQVAAANLTTCPCWTIVSTGTQVDVVYCDGSKNSVYFPPNDDGSAKTTKLCALSIDTQNAHGGTITATTNSLCYNDTVNGGFSCTPPPPVCPVCVIPEKVCGGIDGDPWKNNRTRSLYDGEVNIRVVQACGTPGQVRYYEEFERLFIVPSKEADAFCMNTQFRDCRNQGQIKNGFIYTSIDCGKIYLSYLGSLEDEDGNLLVLDHPKINEYYEWAIKERLLSNLYLNGDDFIQRLQFTQKELSEAKQSAHSIINMPDLREMMAISATVKAEFNRKYLEPLNHWAHYWRYGLNGYDGGHNGRRY